MNFENIKYRIDHKICFIKLYRPEKRNAFNAALVHELKNAFLLADNNDEVKVIVLKAEGNTFSAGADLSYLQSLQNNSYAENVQDSKNLMELYKMIYTISKPVIAQIEGHAIAGGCGLASVCDFSYAIPEAQFGYTEVRIGFIPAIVMVFLLRKINERNAKELLLTGKLIDAIKAKELGLINEVVDKNEIQNYVLEMAQSLIDNCSRESLKATKQMIAHVQEMNLDQALNDAAEKNAAMRETADCKYGIKSFLEKKKPDWA